MSPAQTKKQLAKQYYLALSQRRATQTRLYSQDHLVSQVQPAQMKLLIKTTHLQQLSNKS